MEVYAIIRTDTETRENLTTETTFVGACGVFKTRLDALKVLESLVMEQEEGITDGDENNLSRVSESDVDFVKGVGYAEDDFGNRVEWRVHETPYYFEA